MWGLDSRPEIPPWYVENNLPVEKKSKYIATNYWFLVHLLLCIILAAISGWKPKTFLLLQMCSSASTFSSDWCFTSASGQLEGLQCCTNKCSAWGLHSHGECCAPADKNLPWRKNKTIEHYKHDQSGNLNLLLPWLDINRRGLDWPVSFREGVIQYGSRWWRAEGVGHPGVQGGVDALLDQNEDHLWLVVANVLKTLDQLWYLVLLHHGHLTLRHTVSIDHNLLRETVVHLHQGQNR